MHRNPLPALSSSSQVRIGGGSRTRPPQHRAADAADLYAVAGQFDTQPAKRRPGYANFAITEPPLKLVLLENPGLRRHAEPPRRRGGLPPPQTLRPTRPGSQTRASSPTRRKSPSAATPPPKDKFWVTAPDGERWEPDTVLADSPTFRGEDITGDACCADASWPPPVGELATAGTARRGCCRFHTGRPPGLRTP